MKISVNIGKGLKFENHKITTDTSLENSLMQKKADGLYVPNLNGVNGGVGGTSTDNITIIESYGKLQLNVDYVQCIYSMGVYVVSDRSSMVLKYSSTLKNMTNIITEMNLYAYANYTAYYFRPGDLFQLVSFSLGTKPWGYSSGYMEDSNRYISNGDGSNETKVLFVVDSATYSGHRCTQLTLTCLYTKAGEISNFVKGNTYNYN